MLRPTRIMNFIRAEGGASMVEYAVALLVITTVGVTLMSTLGTETGVNVADACQSINNNVSC